MSRARSKRGSSTRLLRARLSETSGGFRPAYSVRGSLRLTHTHERAVMFPRQRPQEGADVGAFVEEADGVDAHLGTVRQRAVPVGQERLPHVLAQDLISLGFLHVRGGVGQA